jgi:hypothetical protein
MKLIRRTVGLAIASLLLLHSVVAANGQSKAQAPAGAPTAGQAVKPSPPNRQLRRSLYMAPARPPGDPAAPPWRLGPVPAEIAIRIAGIARDEQGNPVAGAKITLYPLAGSKPAGSATTDDQGRYQIDDAMLPVATSLNGVAFPREITPYSDFNLAGQAPGLGIAWSAQHGMYAVKEPSPEDIQGRLPLGQLVAIDLVFPRAAALLGKVVDERGQPVEGVKLQVLDCDLLDDDGHETNNRQGYDWKAVPDTIGRAVTTRDGRFRLAGIAGRACYWIGVTRPETDNASLAFYAATIPGAETVHEQLPADAFNGRGRHQVKTNPITIDRLQGRQAGPGRLLLESTRGSP